MQALREYRKQKGLCFKCGERWGKEHSCPPKVQIHVVEELLDMFSHEDVTGADSLERYSEEQEMMCSLSLFTH
jgi:hypothetical protein